MYWWRFRKFLWPSQNICMNFNSGSEQFLKQNTNHLFFAGTKYFFDVGILLSEMGVCKLSSVDMLPAALRQNSVKLQWLNPILPSDSEYRNLRMVACDTTICDFEVSTILHFYILSIKFSLVFPCFVYLLATKPMVKQSRASGQSSGLRTGLKSDFFFFKFFRIVQFLSHFCSCAYLSNSANLESIPINFISLKVPPAKF